jgi:hypothetical protein
VFPTISGNRLFLFPMLRNSFKKLLLLSIMIAASTAIWAQLPDPGGGGFPCGGEFGPCPIPLDGGLTLLLASGLAIGGAKMIKDRDKNSN